MEASVSKKKPDWREISREWEASGQSQKDFCQERGYSFSQFRDARSKLGLTRLRRAKPGRKTASSVAQFLPLTVRPESSSVDNPPAPRPVLSLELELPLGITLRLYGTESKR